MEAVESKPKVAVMKMEKSARRLCAGDLSDAIRARIVKLAEFHESTDKAAIYAKREFPMLPITRALVTDVLLFNRKPPMRESASAIPMRRMA